MPFALQMTCEAPHCGDTFFATRSDARYCSPACRQRAHRDRRSVTAKPDIRNAPPVTANPPVPVTTLDADIAAFAEEIRVVLRDYVPPADGDEPPEPEEVWDRLAALIPDFDNRMLQLEYRWVEDDLNDQEQAVFDGMEEVYDKEINLWFNGFRNYSGTFAEYIEETPGFSPPYWRARFDGKLHPHRPDCFDFIEQFIRDREQEWEDRR